MKSELCLPYMCRYCLLPDMCHMCWHVCVCGSMWQHSNRKAAHSDSKRTISSTITCTPWNLHLSGTPGSQPDTRLIPLCPPCLLSYLISLPPAHQLSFSISVSFISTCLSHTSALACVSVAFLTASVAFPACPLLHFLSSPPPYIACFV